MQRIVRAPAGCARKRADKPKNAGVAPSAESGAPDQPLITVWAGVSAAVVAISIPGLAPDSLQVSLRGKCMMLRGAARDVLFSHDVLLPWPAMPNPVHIDDGSCILHVLLQRKQTPSRPIAGNAAQAIMNTVRVGLPSGSRRRGEESFILKSLEGMFGHDRHARREFPPVRGKRAACCAGIHRR